jgi:hypothetical protein
MPSQPSLFTAPVVKIENTNTAETLDERFERWLAVNPHILKAFIHFALELQQRGRKHIGAKFIIERMRWEYYLRSTEDDFKLNNSYTSRLARRAVQEKAELSGLFEFRGLKRKAKNDGQNRQTN